MIKQYIKLLLLCAVCIILCSCEIDKEELFINAVDLPIEEIQKDLEQKDMSSVGAKYSENFYKICGKVSSVDTDNKSISVHPEGYSCTVECNLSKEEMKNMEEGLYVNVAGKIDSIEKRGINSFDINFSKPVYIDNAVEVEGFIANISNESFFVLKDEKTLVGKTSLVFHQEQDGTMSTNAFSDEATVERFINENEDLNYFSVDGEEFYNGDTVVLECVKVNDVIRDVLKIECTGTNGEHSARKYINDLYSAGEKYISEGIYDQAHACFKRLLNYKDAQSKATEALNKVLDANKDTDLSKMQGMWHSIENCYNEKGSCEFIKIEGTLVCDKPHVLENSYSNWAVCELSDNKLKSEWVTKTYQYDQVVEEHLSKQFLFFEDGNIIKIVQYDDGKETKTTYYKTSSEVISKSSDGYSAYSGKKCAKSGCDSNAVTTGDSIYCAKHSNRCLNCSCYIDGDAMYCMSCIKKALR